MIPWTYADLDTVSAATSVTNGCCSHDRRRRMCNPRVLMLRAFENPLEITLTGRWFIQSNVLIMEAKTSLFGKRWVSEHLIVEIHGGKNA